MVVERKLHPKQVNEAHENAGNVTPKIKIKNKKRETHTHILTHPLIHSATTKITDINNDW